MRGIALILMLTLLVACSPSTPSNSHEMHTNVPMTGELGVDIVREGVREEIPDRKESAIVNLESGDTFDLSAQVVRDQIRGVDVERFAYNGMLPGPTLRVKKGSEVTVAFTNNLESPTTIHWHGLRLDRASDGVPDALFPAVSPKGTTTYFLKFPDEGLFWYHPHVREDYGQEMGLYGTILVEPADGKDASFDREEIVILDDLLWSTDKVAPFYADRITHAMMGRFGNLLLVNGEEDFTFRANTGEVIRWYLLNAANTRTFNLSIEGTSFRVVGSDTGKYEKEWIANSIIIAPSERYILEMRFTNAGSYRIEHHSPSKSYILGKIEMQGEPTEDTPLPAKSNPEVISEMNSLRLQVKSEVDWEMTLKANGELQSTLNRKPIEWEDSMPQMNRVVTNQMITWSIEEAYPLLTTQALASWGLDKLVRVRIINPTEGIHSMQHPIHLHGNRFVVLETNGKSNDNMVWKDTVLVYAGDTVDILLELSNPGLWMAHCHIAEHLHSGMATEYSVQRVVE